jgi:hypothetical protein
MNTVSPEAVAHSKDLTFEFSETLRGESVNLNDYSGSTYVIDIDGTIYQGESATEDSAKIVIIGGIDKFINEKIERQAVNFYLSEQQKLTIYKIIKELASFYQNAQISSSNETLQQSITALYSNYTG